MRKVLNGGGGLSLSPEGHGMTPHSLCWARTNSPVNILVSLRRFTQQYIRIGYKNIPVNFGGAPKVPDSGK